MNKLTTKLTLEERRKEPYHTNQSRWQETVRALNADRAKVALGGGDKAMKRQHDKKRLAVRERIAKLIDKGSAFCELMTFAGHGLYEEVGGAVSGGVVTGTGKIGGRDWMVIANDATVKAGAFFPITAKKVIRAQTIAMENRLPTVYLVDSAGVYLPMQDEIFPDQDDFGRVFYLNARMSALGIPQIAAIMGNCVAGGAYLPVMCDTLVMTEGSGLYLAGPALVKAAIGQDVTSEELGGADMHAEIAGTVDYHEPDDAAALARVRNLAQTYAPSLLARWAQNRWERKEPKLNPEALHAIVPVQGGSQPFDIREVIGRLVDASEFDEYKARYGQTLVCGTARLGGYAVGIVANQKTVVKTQGKLEVGGVIYASAADKAARFILNCNQAGIAIIFLHDVNGFMVGRASEHEGIIRRGAKMVNAVSNSVVPRLSVILGGSYGAGHYAMSGKAFAPRFIFAWPSAKYSVMGGTQAAKTILDIQAAQLKRSGQKPDDEAIAALYEKIKADYDKALDIRYAAARLWIDEIILPLETRDRLIGALELCAQNPDMDELKLGVFQV
ncbi:MAG: acyl-CoA carboxylase subunit beta [Deinococcota bacterium]|jgi:acetyl-CoA carboxylase carboxyltransferase component|nr:acyl-CoA carboxylase subunit beta [Deinococcota bacterium]